MEQGTPLEKGLAKRILAFPVDKSEVGPCGVGLEKGKNRSPVGWDSDGGTLGRPRVGGAPPLVGPPPPPLPGSPLPPPPSPSVGLAGNERARITSETSYPAGLLGSRPGPGAKGKAPPPSAACLEGPPLRAHGACRRKRVSV